MVLLNSNYDNRNILIDLFVVGVYYVFALHLNQRNDDMLVYSLFASYLKGLRMVANHRLWRGLSELSK